MQDGGQVAFGRVRIRATGLVPNAWYRFTYPFGQIDLQAVDKAPRVVNYTNDVGCLTPPCGDSYSQLSGSDIGPDFLQWDTTESAPPDGYIGDPGVNHRVTGSRFLAPGESEPANYFRIERITGKGGSVIGTVGRTDYFLLQGELAGDAHGHFAATAVQFGDREVGSTSERTATIRNNGAGDLALGTPHVTGDDVDDFALASGGTCELPGTLQPGETCTLRVSFSPAAARDHSARLAISQDGANETTMRSIALSGTGTARPAPIVTAPTPAAQPAPAAASTTSAAPAAPVAPTASVLGQTTRSSRRGGQRAQRALRPHAGEHPRAGAAARAPDQRRGERRAGAHLQDARQQARRARRAALPVTVAVPRGASLVRLRVLTTANKALFSTFTKVKGGTNVKIKVRSAKLRKQLRAGKRYVIEVRAGTARNRLGKATRKTIRVRA